MIRQVGSGSGSETYIFGSATQFNKTVHKIPVGRAAGGGEPVGPRLPEELRGDDHGAEAALLAVLGAGAGPHLVRGHGHPHRHPHGARPARRQVLQDNQGASLLFVYFTWSLQNHYLLFNIDIIFFGIIFPLLTYLLLVVECRDPQVGE